MAAADDHMKVRAAESRIEFAMAGWFTLLLAGTLAYVHVLFQPLTPPARLWGWSVMMGCVIAIMLVVPIIVFLRRPDDREIGRVWSPVGKVVAVLYDTAVAASVWILLPFASEPLRLLMVVFYTAAVGGQVVTTAESLGTVAYGVVSILGSAALFFLLTPGPYSIGLAAFLAASGAMMLFVAVTLKVAIRSAISARLQAEKVSEQLAAALRDVTEARDAKTRFIASAAHDLRQPLQAAALFFDQSVSGAEAVREPAAEGVRLALGEADGLLERMLDYLRLDAGAVEAKIEAAPIGPLLGRVVDEASGLAALEDCRLSIGPTSLAVQADPAMVARILRNFIHNALNHADAKRVLIGARRHGPRVRIYVLDNGAGVPPAERERIFEAYARGAEAARDARRGLGLGLASAARMAELMGGRVGLDPAWKKGAAFFVELPAAVRT